MPNEAAQSGTMIRHDLGADVAKRDRETRKVARSTVLLLSACRITVS
jgi:hypothetical protein